jgi:hypothetical protein
MFQEFCRRHTPELLIALFGLIFVAAAFGGVEGEAGAFLASALDVALFVILAMLVHLAGTRHPAYRQAAIIWLFAVVAGLAITTASLGAVAILPGEIDPDLFDPELAATVALLFLGVFAAGLLSLVGLSRRFRVWLAGYLPFDPDSLLHTVALVVILAMILIPPIPLLVTGIPPYLSPPFIFV